MSFSYHFIFSQKTENKILRKRHLTLGYNGFIYANYETTCYDQNATGTRIFTPTIKTNLHRHYPCLHTL